MLVSKHKSCCNLNLYIDVMHRYIKLQLRMLIWLTNDLHNWENCKPKGVHVCLMIWISILHHALGPLLLMYSSCILDRNFKFKMIHIDIKFTLEISIYKTIQQLVISREMPQILIYSHRESNKCEQYFILNRTWFLLDHESSLWKDPPRACYELGLSLQVGGKWKVQLFWVIMHTPKVIVKFCTVHNVDSHISQYMQCVVSLNESMHLSTHNAN